MMVANLGRLKLRQARNRDPQMSDLYIYDILKSRRKIFISGVHRRQDFLQLKASTGLRYFSQTLIYLTLH